MVIALQENVVVLIFMGIQDKKMAVDVKAYKFGVVGYGFLGTALVHGFGLHADIKIHDKFKDYDSLEDVVEHADVIWMCLPTPMNMQTRAIDLSILEENLEKINGMVDGSSPRKIIVIKSTVVPGTTRAFSEKYTNLDFVMNPEFLTARNNRLDFICASRVILGGKHDAANGNDRAVEMLAEIYGYRFGNSVPIYKCSWEEAELTKYGANCFFAAKISYFNFIYELCEKMGLEYANVRDMILSDGRIGRSHANVPGWDSQRGYSGSCFPKDVNALIAFAKEQGVDPKLLEASWEQNLKDRPSKDWEDIPSAVSNKDKE